MILTPMDARKFGLCIYQITHTTQTHFIPRGGKREGLDLNACIGSECIAYWRWADEKCDRGYCSLGSKPIF